MNPLTDEPIRKLFEQTAETLSGRIIILRFRDPLADHANGECYKSQEGITRVNISPRLDYQQAFYVMLHEAAHAKLNHIDEPITERQYKLTAGMDAREVNKGENKSIEDPAQVLAERWIERGHEAIKHMIRWNTTAQQRAVMNCTALQTLHKLGEL